MQKIIVLIIVLLTMQKCSNQNNVINSSGINAIVITLDDKEQKAETSQREIKNKDTVNIIIKKLNRSKREPIKFYPTHTLKLIYDNGHEDVVFCSGTSMKYQGLTYKLNENIRSIVGY